jgi:hypothetical protein
MNRVHKFITSFAALAAFTVCASPALAGPTYSCKRDKVVDAPMQFTATVVGGRVELSASGGSDKSGWIAPSNNGAWKVFDATGLQVTRFTESLMTFAASDVMKEANLEGLLPGTYKIVFTTIDLCGNQGTSQRSVTVAAPAYESTPPVIADLQLVTLSYMGATAYSVYFTASDNSGIRRVWVEAGGSVLADYSYFNGTSYRWWTDFFPNDSTMTAFEGPTFQVGYDSALKGKCGVRVFAEDLSGNQTVATGDFCLP